MLSLYNRASMRHALSLPLEPQLHRLFSAHIAHLTASADYDLTDLTHFLIIQPGDTEGDIEEAVGFSPLVNPLSDARFGSPDFHPHWDWLQNHGGWFELIFTVGNDGFAFILFIQDTDGVDPNLLTLCHSYDVGAS